MNEYYDIFVMDWVSSLGLVSGHPSMGAGLDTNLPSLSLTANSLPLTSLYNTFVFSVL